jgi:hypothetical protein
MLLDEGEIFPEEESQCAGRDLLIRRERENSVICVCEKDHSKRDRGNGERKLTIARQMKVTNPRREKYTMNVGRLKSMRRSSRDRVCSGTMPKKAIRMAPAAMRMVPRIIHGEKTSPSSSRAKKAFHSSDTAPNGARMTTGREAIWTKDPRMLDEMKITKPSNHNLSIGSSQSPLG